MRLKRQKLNQSHVWLSNIKWIVFKTCFTINLFQWTYYLKSSYLIFSQAYSDWTLCSGKSKRGLRNVKEEETCGGWNQEIVKSETGQHFEGAGQIAYCSLQSAQFNHKPYSVCMKEPLTRWSFGICGDAIGAALRSCRWKSHKRSAETPTHPHRTTLNVRSVEACPACTKRSG